MQVWFPCQPGEHLHVGVGNRRFLRGAFPAEEIVIGDLRRVVEAPLQPDVPGHHEHLRDFTLLRLDACGVNKHQPLQVRAGHGGDLSGDPAADGVAHQHVLADSKFLGQFQGEVGNVGYGVDPTGPRRAEEAGMRRRVHGEIFGQGAVGGIEGAESLAAVEKQQWRAGATGEHLDGCIGHGNGGPIADSRLGH